MKFLEKYDFHIGILLISTVGILITKSFILGISLLNTVLMKFSGSTGQLLITLLFMAFVLMPALIILIAILDYFFLKWLFYKNSKTQVIIAYCLTVLIFYFNEKIWGAVGTFDIQSTTLQLILYVGLSFLIRMIYYKFRVVEWEP